MTKNEIEESIKTRINDGTLYVGQKLQSYNELYRIIGLDKHDYNNGKRKEQIRTIVNEYISAENTPFYNSRFGITISKLKEDDDWQINTNELDKELFLNNDREFWGRVNNTTDIEVEKAELEEAKSRYNVYMQGGEKLPDFVVVPVSSTLSFVDEEYRYMVNHMDVPLGVLCDIADLVEYPKDNCKYNLLHSNEGIMQMIADRNEISLAKVYEYLKECVEIGWLFKTKYQGIYLVNPWFVCKGRVRLKLHNPYIDFYYDKDLHKWVFLNDVDEVVK